MSEHFLGSYKGFEILANLGLDPLQKMAQKDPKKKMLSMAVNAIMHLEKLAAVESHHLRAHFAFNCTHGAVLIARRR